jgi:hypothetical protein
LDNAKGTVQQAALVLSTLIESQNQSIAQGALPADHSGSLLTAQVTMRSGPVEAGLKLVFTMTMEVVADDGNNRR